MERSDEADERLEVSFPNRRFEPGQLGMTPAAQDAITHEEMITALRRHLAGDWGDVDEHDWQENELSLREGVVFRIIWRDFLGALRRDPMSPPG
jgi:hypothetical protein